jgi:hypothetical protein
MLSPVSYGIDIDSDGTRSVTAEEFLNWSYLVTPNSPGTLFLLTIFVLVINFIQKPIGLWKIAIH